MKRLANIGIALPLVLLIDAIRKEGGFNRAPNTTLYDSTGKMYTVQYEMVPLNLVQTSNDYRHFRKNPRYPEQFQARDLSTGPEKAKIRNIEQNMDLLRIVAPSLDPTIGPPVVYRFRPSRFPNDVFSVLAGNGRTIAFKRWLMQDDDMLRADYSKILTYQGLVNSYFPGLAKGNQKTATHPYMLVRVVKGITFDEAVQLAGASQQSTAGAETPLRSALSKFRSWNIDVQSVPNIMTPMPITRDTIGKFIKENPSFWLWITKSIPNLLSVQMFNEIKDVSIKLEVLNAMLVGLYLPYSVIEVGFENLSEERIVMMMLPYIGAIHQDVQIGRVRSAYDLFPYWETAREFTNITRGKGYQQALDYYNNRCDKNQMKLFEFVDPICEMPKLGIALSFFIKHASNLVNPLSSVRRLGNYLDEIRKDDPRQMTFLTKPKTHQQIDDQAYSLFMNTVLPKKVTSVLGSLFRRR